MKIFTRYLAREFAQNFFLGLGAFSVTYLIVEIFERINAFMYNKATWVQVGTYLLNRSPSIFFQVTPAAVLLSSIITLGVMSRHGEITAMKSGGVSLWTLVHPILGVVGVIFLGVLGLNEFIVPPANQNARAIYNWVIHKKKPVDAFKQSQIWIHGQQRIYNLQLYQPEKQSLQGLTLYRFNSQFTLVQRVDARSAQWKDGKWVLSDVSVTDFSQGGVPVRKNYQERTISLPETPGDFQIAEKDPKEMNYRELRDYVHKIEQDGYNSSKYRTALHACISYPFICVIMAFLGIPLALRRERGGGMAVGVGYSILISFIYLVVYSFILELGKGGSFPPFLAAWLGNVIFLLVGIYLFLSIRH